MYTMYQGFTMAKNNPSFGAVNRLQNRVVVGGPSGARTRDPLIKSQML